MKTDSKKLSNNQILIQEIVKQDFSENDNYKSINDFFEFFAANQILKQYDLSYEELESGITGSGLDGGCDGLYLFLNGTLVTDDYDFDQLKKDIRLEFFLLQSKYVPSFSESVFDKWKTTSENLLSMSNNLDDFVTRYNTDVLDAFSRFRETYIKLIRKSVRLDIKYIYISKGIELHPNVIAQSDELKILVRKIFPGKNISVDVSFIGANELMDLVNEQNDDVFGLKLCESPISYGNSNDFISLVKLSEYYKFITDENGELIRHIFESNVRDYQGHTTVNSEIQRTLVENHSGEFWWLNNGVTIICKESSLVTSKELSLISPEIVNGLQTSTEIYSFFDQNKDKILDDSRSLLVRIIVPENDEERDKIILATNSQTSIPKASLRATDSIHRQIEMFFKNRGLYYDRRKNYYKNLGKKPSSVISIPFFGQILMSVILSKPDYARARPSTVLTNDEEYKKLFNDNISLESYFNIAQIGKKIEIELKKLDEYNTVQKGDILFYLIYYSICIKSKTTRINDSVLKSLNYDDFDEKFISECSSIIYQNYQELGGNSKVAKGPDLIVKLKDLIKFDIV